MAHHRRSHIRRYLALTAFAGLFLSAFLLQCTTIRASDEQLSAIGSRESQFPEYFTHFDQMIAESVACGPLSLIEIARFLGAPFGPEEETALLRSAGRQGTDFLHLSRLAKQHGLYTLGVRIDADVLARLNCPAIVSLQGGTFAGLLSHTTEGFQLVYPGNRVRTLSITTFRAAFGQPGHALLVTNRRKTISEVRRLVTDIEEAEQRAPRVRLNRQLVGVGLIHRGRWSGSFEVENAGNAPLLVNQVVPSCSCLKVTSTEAVIPPRGSARVVVNGEDERPGAFAYTIALATNDLLKPSIAVPIRGTVTAPVVFATPAAAIEAQPGEQRGLKFPIRLAPGIDPAALRVSVQPATAPIRASVIDVHDDDAGFTRAGILIVTFQGERKPGTYNYDIVVSEAPVLEDVCSATLRLTVRIKPSVQISPESVFIAEREFASGWSRRLFVSGFRAAEPSAVKIDWSDPGIAEMLSLAISREPDGRIGITLTPGEVQRMNALANTLAHMRITVEDGTVLEVPLYFGLMSLLEPSSTAAESGDPPTSNPQAAPNQSISHAQKGQKGASK